MPLTPSSPWLSSLIDYAGLFPPASRDLPAAVHEYSALLASPYAPMLGRFIIPVARLGELARILHERPGSTGTGRAWNVSVLVGSSVGTGLETIAGGIARGSEVIQIGSVEAAGSPLAATEQLERRAFPDFAPSGTHYFFETDWRHPDQIALHAQQATECGVGLKIRTGGVEPSAIPSAEAIVGFLVACANVRVPFKATAGLHHALPGVFPLSYEPGSRRARMQGFLNLFAAAGLCWLRRIESEDCANLLREMAPPKFERESGTLHFGRYALAPDEMSVVRSDFARSFGSCSFNEPVDELTTLGLL